MYITFLQNNHNHLAYMKCVGQCRARVKTNSRGCHSHRTKNNTAPTRILMVKAIFINIGNIIMAQLISWWRLISHWFPLHLSPPSLYVQDMIMIISTTQVTASDVFSSDVWCVQDDLISTTQVSDVFSSGELIPDLCSWRDFWSCNCTPLSYSW